MQLLPGGGGGSDLGKLLTIAAIGAGAYYGLGGLGGFPDIATETVGGQFTTAAIKAQEASALYGTAGAGVGASILEGAKAAAPLAAVGLASGLMTPRMPGFPNIPAIPSRADKAVSEARRNQMELDKLRKGRAASILTGSRGVEGELGSVSRPAARAAQLLGD